MVEELKVAKKVIKPPVEYPNVSQSFHIGINEYDLLKNKDIRSIHESHEDVKEYKNFFLNDLKYQRVSTHTDHNKFSQKKQRE